MELSINEKCCFKISHAIHKLVYHLYITLSSSFDSFFSLCVIQYVYIYRSFIYSKNASVKDMAHNTHICICTRVFFIKLMRTFLLLIFLFFFSAMMFLAMKDCQLVCVCVFIGVCVCTAMTVCCSCVCVCLFFCVIPCPDERWIVVILWYSIPNLINGAVTTKLCSLFFDGWWSI